ncbi:ATP-binding protein [Mycolicibacterium sp. BiH015]|uniref:sensor histidine kinase n=1 Tax=Mycolicibacterium sp. BiH015 TaxID=3018808 RepID=UPI0022E07279|nr:ATP-binding protein [Mycolicibacterium sp. BiH015]MDA2894698.1 ATP-binding protein [Mycolicibacterium sp. BiH015]
MSLDKRPARWAPSNWPVRAKVLAIVVVPLLLACAFGGLRVWASSSEALDLRRAADRAEMVPAVVDYMAALEGAMVTATEGGDTATALREFDAGKSELQHLLGATEVDDSVRLATNTLIDYGQDLIDKITAGSVDLRTRVMTYAPLLITAETAITGLVGDDAAVRAEGDVLSRAVGARGQMAMQRMLVTRGGDLPEPVLRSAIVTIAGTEPATVSAIGAFLGGASDQAASLRSEMVKRLAVISDPASVLVGNTDLLASQQVTANIADGVIARTADAIPATVSRQADDARTAAIRDAALVGAAILVALILVTLVARSLVRPLRTLRDSALKVAHEDLAREVEHVRSDGKEFPVQPIPVHTTEEVGQVAHAVDELHQQALMLAGEQARLALQVTDMFETLSRRNRSLVDQQLSLIDQLERDEEDPGRLESLFRLDHLAARMRRNGANLMVLAGAQMSREQSDPVRVAALVNAAASEVEEYTRVVTASLPDSEIDGAVAGDLAHLLAELIDNALRYSPPSTKVQVSAVPTGNNGLVIEVSDTGLGMTESDLRVANTRLESGGEVNPYTARHMGLFVVGRLAATHGLVVRLRSTVAGQADSGTTAGVYIPSRLLTDTRPVARSAGEQTPADAPAGLVTAPSLEGAHRAPVQPVVSGPAAAPAAAPADVALPQRRPGASGIVEPSPAPTPSPPAPRQTEPPRPSVASYFSVRPQPPAPPEPEAPRAGHAALGDDDDAIYQKMLSEWLVDPHELSHSSDLNWKSVWDNGWSAAQAAEATPVRDRTADGLPVRQPGARLVPGHADERPLASADGSENGHALPTRNPDAVRTSIGSHFGGVHAGRRRAQEAGGTDNQ